MFGRGRPVDVPIGTRTVALAPNVRSLARHSAERARLCVSAPAAIGIVDHERFPNCGIAIYHPASDRDPRTSPQAVARAACCHRAGRRFRRAGGEHRGATLPPTPATTKAGHAGGGGHVERSGRHGAAPAPPAAPPVKPDPPYVAAAKRRKKIPFWAMATLSLMPVWAFIYVRALTEAPRSSPVRSASESRRSRTAPAAMAPPVKVASAASSPRVRS